MFHFILNQIQIKQQNIKKKMLLRWLITMVSQLHMHSYLQSLLKPAATDHSDMLELFGKWHGETVA
jgi:hypothetical protein